MANAIGEDSFTVHDTDLCANVRNWGETFTVFLLQQLVEKFGVEFT